MMKNLVSLVWWPHSGGRWLSRSILKNHTKIYQTTFVHPWIFNSSDDVLSNDITAQIHKARSLPDLHHHLKALSISTDIGRSEGLRHYYNYILNTYEVNDKVEIILGESCMGSPSPKPVDLNSIYRSFPEMKIIHLVRNPVDSFASFKNRIEMDGDPIKIAGSWNTLNTSVRSFFEKSENINIKDKYHLVRYEDLMTNPKEEVEKICEFCNLEFENNMIEDLDERWGKRTISECDPAAKEIINSVAQLELSKYGYLQ